MYNLNLSSNGDSVNYDSFDNSSEDENESSPKKVKEKNFNVQEKIKELMSKPSPSSYDQRRTSINRIHVSTHSKKFRRGDGINKGVNHNIKRPKVKIQKAKKKVENNAKKVISRIKAVKMPPRYAMNRSPVKPALKGKVKRHKLASPGSSFFDSPQEADCDTPKTNKFFTSRAKAAATINIRNTMNLSAMNGEIKMREYERNFERKNIGRYIEAELEKKIASASLSSPITSYSLDSVGKLPSVASRKLGPKPSRFCDSPSPDRRKLRPSTPKQSPTRSSARKKTPRSDCSPALVKTPRRTSPKKPAAQRTLLNGSDHQNGLDRGHHLAEEVGCLSLRVSPRRGSPLRRKSPVKEAKKRELESLDFILDEANVPSEEDEIISSLLKENQTPEKALNSPRRSPRRYINSPRTKGNMGADNAAVTRSPQTNKNVKYFPLFEPKKTTVESVTSRQVTKASPSSKLERKRFIMKKSDKTQLIIDAGQKEFGATFCKDCGFLYENGDPEDEENHYNFHQSLPSCMKYSGWKNERQVTNLDHLGGRVIHVIPTDAITWWRKVNDILKCVDNELGFSENGVQRKDGVNAFLYAREKLIVGVLIAEEINKAYRVIHAASTRTPAAAEGGDSGKLICCSDTPQKVCFGISRIWVAAPNRRKGVATKLVDAMRANVVPYCYLAEDTFAFSDPTPFGMKFAEKYTKKPDFLVYRRE